MTLSIAVAVTCHSPNIWKYSVQYTGSGQKTTATRASATPSAACAAPKRPRSAAASASLSAAAPPAPPRRRRPRRVVTSTLAVARARPHHNDRPLPCALRTSWPVDPVRQPASSPPRPPPAIDLAASASPSPSPSLSESPAFEPRRDRLQPSMPQLRPPASLGAVRLVGVAVVAISSASAATMRVASTAKSGHRRPEPVLRAELALMTATTAPSCTLEYQYPNHRAMVVALWRPPSNCRPRSVDDDGVARP
mmetsp:Transcript_10924/g.38037  ORF Transcript_10924/g.38037 Transcript_10924/m.38037 type:complete len:251 (-) Transcript_10924:590-1342(-)